VLKPAEQSSAIAAMFFEICLKAGVPPGALHLVPGLGEEVGARLVADPRVVNIAFTGSLEVGKAADVVLWSAEPFSVYSRPMNVWIDGALMYDWGDPKRRPIADFELGQPGAGDVK
jgi:hypothetical protein